MLVKYTKFYPYFRRKGMCNRSAKVEIKSCSISIVPTMMLAN